MGRSLSDERTVTDFLLLTGAWLREMTIHEMPYIH